MTAQSSQPSAWDIPVRLEPTACPRTRGIRFIADWTGETVVIVASGPSARDAPLDMVRGRCRCIAVNNSWMLAPWADAIYGADGAWWKANDTSAFAGLKITADAGVAVALGLHHVAVDQQSDALLFGDAIGHGGMSGFQALNIAVLWGARRIVLVGYDLNDANHWHGDHQPPLRNPTPRTIARCRRALERAAPVLAARGVTVVNASPGSALRRWPVMPLPVGILTEEGGSKVAR